MHQFYVGAKPLFVWPMRILSPYLLLLPAPPSSACHEGLWLSEWTTERSNSSARKLPIKRFRDWSSLTKSTVMSRHRIQQDGRSLWVLFEVRILPWKGVEIHQSLLIEEEKRALYALQNGKPWKVRSWKSLWKLRKKHIMDFDFTSELNYNRDRSASSLESLLYEITISLGLVVYLRNSKFSWMQLATRNPATRMQIIIFKILWKHR